MDYNNQYGGYGNNNQTPMNFDPNTGQPINQPPMNFDPNTGQPINQAPVNYDPYAGQQMNQAPANYNPYNGQQMNYNQNMGGNYYQPQDMGYQNNNYQYPSYGNQTNMSFNQAPNGYPGNYPQDQGGYPPQQNNGNYSAPENSPILKQNKDVFLAADPESNTKTFAKVAIVLIIGGIAAFFLLGFRTTTCEKSQDFGGIDTKLTVKVTTLFNRVIKINEVIKIDYSKYEGESKGFIEQLEESSKDACKEYKSGCSVSTKSTDDTFTASVSITGKTLDEFEEKNFMIDFKDFDRKKLISESHGICK